LRIVFMGTPDFSVPCLEGLIENGNQIVLVVTQADKPKGRGHHLTPPPVKECALSHGIPVFQPNRMKDEESRRILEETHADLFVVVAYGKILPADVLAIPRYGCINIHASLLPKYRGAAPIQWSIMSGERKTGVTAMQMDVGLDTGDMLLKKEIEIDKIDTTSTLHDKLSQLGREVLLDTISSLEKGTLQPEKQRDEEACYAPMITKETAQIDFNCTAEEICRKIRAMNSYPYAQTIYAGKLMKIIAATPVLDDKLSGKPGEIIGVKGNALIVKCGNGGISVSEIQVEGKKKMSVFEYVKGNAFTEGEILGLL